MTRSHFHAFRDSDLDVDRLTLIQMVLAATEQGDIDSIQDDIDDVFAPRVTWPAADPVPLPPIAAVLVTAIYLTYIGQDVSTDNVLWTLHHYWRGAEAAALHIGDWQRGVDRAATVEPDACTLIGFAYLKTWTEVALDSIADLIA